MLIHQFGGIIMIRDLGLNVRRFSAPLGVAAIAALSVALASCSPQLAACDNAEILNGLKAGINNSTHQEITSITNVATASHTATTAACTAHIVAASGAEADIAYNLNLNGSDTHYVLGTVTQTHAPNAAPDAAAAPEGGGAAAAPAAEGGEGSAENAAPAEGEGGEAPSN